MVFGSGIILNTAFIEYWEATRLNKQKIIDKNNLLENKKVNCTCIKYNIKYECVKKLNKCEEPYVGPYPITQLWTNRNVIILRGAVQERINIKWIKLYCNKKKCKCASDLQLGRVVQQAGMPLMDLETNKEYRLGLMI